VLVVIGFVLALVGFVAPVFFALGSSLALTAVTVRLATSWLDRRRPVPGDQQDDPVPRPDDKGSGERPA
jgi:hypothetical protein